MNNIPPPMPPSIASAYIKNIIDNAKTKKVVHIDDYRFRQKGQIQ